MSDVGGTPMLVGPLRVAAAAALTLVIGFFAVTALVGGFATLAVEEREVGPFGFAYVELFGADFAQVADLSGGVRARLIEAGIEPGPPMAIFYGDSLEGTRPNEVGVLLDPEQLGAVSALESDLETRTIPRAVSMTTSFDGSSGVAYVVGYFRAESVLGEYRDARRYRREPLVVIERTDHIEYVQAAVPN